jgi:hypothetical protein
MSLFARVPLATTTPVTSALPSISIVPLAIEEELVVSAVLRVVSLAQRAVYKPDHSPRHSSSPDS